MGRRHHLEAVYRSNLEIAGQWPGVEFVLLDYHSPDGLADWVRTELAEWIERGVLRYFRTAEPRRFHVAHAKNVAHRLATGDVLVNLDADNFFGEGYAGDVAALFADGARVVADFADFHAGCFGRIALRREDFIALGGYNERFTGWGYEDADLVHRAEAMGMTRRHFHPRHAQAIQHGNRERTRFTAEKRIYRNNRRNHAASDADVAAGRLVANAGRDWGRATVLPSFADISC